jgi:hypothetical protein
MASPRTVFSRQAWGTRVMSKAFLFVSFFIVLSIGIFAHAQNDEEIKSELFVCGENEELGSSHHIGLTNDGRLVSFATYNGESFAPVPVFYFPAKISMEKHEGKCVITTVEKIGKNQKVRNFEFEMGQGHASDFKDTSNSDSNLSEKSRQCTLSQEYENTVGQCSYSKDSYDAKKPSIDDLYGCHYVGPAKKVDPAKNNLLILDKDAGKEVCLQQGFCQMKPGVNPQTITKQKLNPYYNNWVACLPVEGVCSKDYKECKEDTGVTMVDQTLGDDNIRKTLGMPTGRAQ